MLDKLQTISYNGVFGVTDITQRVVVASDIPAVPFEQGDHSRGDIVADKIYNDSKLDYLVFLANKTVNPRDLTTLDYNQFEQLLADTFGSVQNAHDQILYFQNNWPTDTSTLSVGGFNSLANDVKQLYNIVKDFKGSIVGYQRKKLNNRKSTSVIVTYSVANCTFTAGQYIKLMSGQAIVGTGRVKSVTSTAVIVDHVVGTYAVTSISDQTTTFSCVLTSQFKVISDTEAPYYSPVTQYQYLYQQIITNRTSINVYPPQYVSQITNNLA